MIPIRETLPSSPLPPPRHLLWFQTLPIPGVCVRVCVFARMHACAQCVCKWLLWEVTPGSRCEGQTECHREEGTDDVKPPLRVTMQGPLGPPKEPYEMHLRTVCQGGQKGDVFLRRHPSHILYHLLLDLLLNGPEAKLSGCTDVNYSRPLLISCVSYSFWNHDKKPQLLWSLKT